MDINYINKSKYVYNNNEPETKVYIFELELYDIDNSRRYIRKLIKKTSGLLIEHEDNIMHEPITRYNLTIIDINNLTNVNIMKGNITDNIIKCNNIYIHFKKDDNLIKCLYNIF
jgi:hypothetical protein